MKLPESLIVGTKRIAILDMESIVSSELDGLFRAVDSTIRVNMNLQSHYLLEVLWHEIKHAIHAAYTLEDSDDEERTVSVSATAEIMLLRDNPELLKFIVETLKAPTK